LYVFVLCMSVSRGGECIDTTYHCIICFLETILIEMEDGVQLSQ